MAVNISFLTILKNLPLLEKVFPLLTGTIAAVEAFEKAPTKANCNVMRKSINADITEAELLAEADPLAVTILKTLPAWADSLEATLVAAGVLKD